MNSNSTMYAANQTSYTVIRPVDDLWLWWTMVTAAGYLAGQLISALLRGPILITSVALIIVYALSFVPVIWVLSRYLGDFNWKRWAVVNVVGVLISAIVYAILTLFALGALGFISAGGSSIGIVIVGAALLGSWIVALAQWRVLNDYAGEQGRSSWVASNIFAALIISIMSLLVNELTDNPYLRIGIETVINALGALIVGFALMRILQARAQSPKITGSTVS